ncbi:GNAT family N-acetyltransferase [Longivirga aurantiaca]|uniref:GNAT family N-acetyltransferase n=1 Tax=Longivirga aurantiaca TaxID=1837743 RepID=A0ABW1T193_9ACTN
MPRIDRVTEDDPAFVGLVTAMVEEMIGLYGGDVGTWKLVPPGGAWLVLRSDDGEPVGCAGVIPLSVAVPDAPTAQGEVKRVYVVPSARGAGHSRRLMAAVTALAPSLGYTELWLETGDLQPIAVSLYERLGWHRIAAYGPYADERSVCFGLHVQPAGGGGGRASKPGSSDNDTVGKPG